MTVTTPLSSSRPQVALAKRLGSLSCCSCESFFSHKNAHRRAQRVSEEWSVASFVVVESRCFPFNFKLKSNMSKDRSWTALIVYFVSWILGC